MPAVKSSDPRKAAFVTKVRYEFPHIAKVTDVFESQGVLSGRAMEWDPGTRTYMFLGEVSCASEAIQAALAYGLRIDKDADPVEGPRTALPYEDAVAVAEVDVGLLSVHGPALVDPPVTGPRLDPQPGDTMTTPFDTYTVVRVDPDPKGRPDFAEVVVDVGNPWPLWLWRDDIRPGDTWDRPGLTSPQGPA